MMRERSGLSGRFWRMCSAVGISSVGDGLFQIALPLLALQYTRSAIAISVVLIAGRAPALLVGLPTGALADRLNRRPLIVAIEIIRFVALGLFALALAIGQGSLPAIYLTAFVMGGLNVAFDVVCGASLPSIVRPEQLVRANAHLLNAENTSENLIGQALGGVALAAGRGVPFLADAATFVASAALLSGAVPNNDARTSESTAWHDLLEGLRWFVRQPVLLLMTAVVATFAFCQSMVFGVLALYGKQELHLTATAYGLMLALSSAGLVLGALLAPWLHDRLGSVPTLIAAGVLAAASYPVLAVTHSVFVATAALLVETAMVIMGQTASRSLRQLLTPAEMQGRAASAFGCTITACPLVGALLGGVLVSLQGLRGAFLTAGLIQVAILAVLGPRLLGHVKRLEGTVVVDLSDAEVPVGAWPPEAPSSTPLSAASLADSTN